MKTGAILGTCFVLLAALSSADAQPTATSSRGHVLFLRDQHIWLMNGDGSDQRQITPHVVRHFSASENGRIVYDRFTPDTTELNVYYIEDIRGGTPKKVTSDNESQFPHISPDGKQMIFQKVKRGDKQNHVGSG